MRGIKQTIALVLCLLLVIGALSGCSQKPVSTENAVNESGSDNVESQKRIKEEFKIGVVSSPSGFDPQKYSDNPSFLMLNMIYNNLIELDDRTMEFYPALAESWEQESENEYVFNLRKGVKFHDGSDFSAKDVLYTFSRGVSMPNTKSKFDAIEKIEAVDDYKVKFTLKNPNPLFYFDIAHKYYQILPDGIGEDIGRNPIGTGPFKMIEEVSDSYVKFERFEEYWDGPQPSKYMTIKIYPEPAARLMALEAGDIDVCYAASAGMKKTVDANPNLEFLQIVSNKVEFFGMSNQKPPFDDIHVRRAVSHAINKRNLLDGAYEGLPEVATSLLVKGATGYRSDLKTYEYDLEKAKEEMAKSKYPNGYKFSLYTTSSRNTGAQLLQYDLSQIGLQMEIEFVNAVFDHAKAGYSGALWSSYQNPSLDGGYFKIFFHSTGNNNVFFYSNDEVDSLFESIDKEQDLNKRNEMIGKVQQMLADDVPAVPMYMSMVNDAINKNVKGYIQSPSTTHKFYTAYVELD